MIVLNSKRAEHRVSISQVDPLKFNCFSAMSSLLFMFCFYFTVHSGIVSVPMVNAKELFDTNGNLSKITWAHAVNNATFLQETLSNDDVMMIEADIRLVDDKPVMQHSENDSWDLTLEEFLSQVENYNKQPNVSSKGVKLDFKTIEAFSNSVDLIQLHENDGFWIWINADILRGPVNSTTEPVDAQQFLEAAAQSKNSTLSIGWTTTHTANDAGSYNSNQIDEMIELCRNNVSLPVTFPVRAVFAAKSTSVLVHLLKNVKDSTLTIWSGEEDTDVNVDDLRTLLGKIGVSKFYIDVPETLLSKIHLDSLPGSAVKTNLSLITLGLATLFAFILKV